MTTAEDIYKQALIERLKDLTFKDIRTNQTYRLSRENPIFIWDSDEAGIKFDILESSTGNYIIQPLFRLKELEIIAQSQPKFTEPTPFRRIDATEPEYSDPKS